MRLTSPVKRITGLAILIFSLWQTSTVTGELAFEIPDVGQERALENNNVTDLGRINNVTVKPVLECQYQYPDLEQFNAMLSNMMNELTKVFVRVHEMLAHEDGRRGLESRFRVVDKKNTNFFEDIYSNMTQDYTQFYNSTRELVPRAATKDPCDNQVELKEVWRRLLEKSLSTLRHAALQCIEKYLHSHIGSDDKRTRYKLGQFLLKEMARVRARQLHMLCDRYQLCFIELM